MWLWRADETPPCQGRQTSSAPCFLRKTACPCALRRRYIAPPLRGILHLCHLRRAGCEIEAGHSCACAVRCIQNLHGHGGASARRLSNHSSTPRRCCRVMRHPPDVVASQRLDLAMDCPIFMAPIGDVYHRCIAAGLKDEEDGNQRPVAWRWPMISNR